MKANAWCRETLMVTLLTASQFSVMKRKKTSKYLGFRKVTGSTVIVWNTLLYGTDPFEYHAAPQKA